jgi:hypothetical protein
LKRMGGHNRRVDAAFVTDPQARKAALLLAQ